MVDKFLACLLIIGLWLSSNVILAAPATLLKLRNVPCISGQGNCSTDINSSLTAGQDTQLADFAWSDNKAGLIKAGTAYQCKISLVAAGGGISSPVNFAVTNGYYGTLQSFAVTSRQQKGAIFAVTATQDGFLGLKVDGSHTPNQNDQVDFICTSQPIQ